MSEDSTERARGVVARILARTGTALESTAGQEHYSQAGELEREARAGTRRIQGLSTELEEISEVEYRQIRLEKVVLVGLRTSGSEEEAENSLRELAALAQTAGSQVLDGVIQKRSHPDPATYLGSGKARELAELVAADGADTVIVDGDLAPSQRRGLEDVVKVKVVDRTALILDIFAQHAKSREGKAQVELAQLEYLLPRLRGWATQCLAKLVDESLRVKVSVHVVRARQRSSWIVVVFVLEWRSCANRSAGWSLRAVLSAPIESVPRFQRLQLPVIRMLGNRRYSMP